jgi:hypothetical protein
MTNDSGITAVSPRGHVETGEAERRRAARSDDAPEGAAEPAMTSARVPGADGQTTRRRPTDLPGVLLLAGLSIVWLAGMLWTARASIRSAGDASVAIFLAAYSLPAVISASLVGGAAVGLAVLDQLAVPLRTRPTSRSLVAAGMGLVTGLAAAGVITLSYGSGSAIMVLGGTVAAAATVGGALSSVRATQIVAASVVASLCVFVVRVLFQPFHGGLMSLYGAGPSGASQKSASGLFAATVAVTSALIAGYLAYRYLRRTARHTRPEPRWPAYLAAGSGAGVMLLLSEALVRIAGGPVLSLAKSQSEIDAAGLAWLDGSRINYGLVVLFVGAITALIAFGRTLPGPTSARTPDEESANGEADAVD